MVLAFGVGDVIKGSLLRGFLSKYPLVIRVPNQGIYFLDPPEILGQEPGQCSIDPGLRSGCCSSDYCFELEGS